MSLDREAFLYFPRSAGHLVFIRSVRCPEGVKPSVTALVDREVLGWTLTSDGSPMRLFYVRVDITRDGLGPFEPDPLYPKSTAGSPNVKLKRSLLPINDDDVPAVVALDEEMQRAPVRKHWVEWHNARAEERRLEKKRANEEHAQRERDRRAAEAAEFAIKLTPRPKPKPRTWLDRLLNRGRS